MKVKVKICGIRSKESLQAAIDAGADFVGFNFVPRSRRYIDLSTAKALATIARNKVALVGVFENSPLDFITKILDEIPLDYVQLHGDEEITYLNNLNKKIIKRISSESAMDIYKNVSNFFLLDRQTQGEGEMVNLEEARKICLSYRTFFSGGLTPENAAFVIQYVKPYAVDVAGGIETDGKEDSLKIRQFIKNAKGINL